MCLKPVALTFPVAMLLMFYPTGALAQVFGFGNNGFDQLGSTTIVNTPVPQSPAISGATAISGSTSHVLALKGDGTVWAWGFNRYGELGYSTNAGTNTSTPTPAQVAGITDVVAVAAGSNHSLALKRDGTVWAWGRNQYGQLGNPSNSGLSSVNVSPLQVTGLTGVIAIAGLYNHCLALRSDGTIWTWGYNFDGQLGSTSNIGTSAPNPTPMQVGSLNGFVAIATGALHSLAVRSDGAVFAWGANTYGQLGYPASTTPNSSPTQVSGVAGMTALAAGANHSFALRSDGTVWAWGYNSDGELGDGATSQYVSTPAQVNNLSNIIGIAAGDLHGAALKSDGTVWTWGFNFYGELGTSTNFLTGSASPNPALVSGLSGIGAISAGSLNTFALIPTPVNITITMPAGVPFSVAGSGCQPGAYSGTTVLSWIPSASCQVTLPAQFGAGTGTQDFFKDWVDGPANSTRAFVAPAVDTSYTAEYKTQYLLTVAANPATAGIVTGGGYYDANTVASVAAIPSSGFVFSSWNGPVTSPGNPSTVSITGPLTVTANIVPAFTLVTATITAANKNYDRTAAASITGCTVIGVLPADQGNVGCSAASAAFADANAGINKTVTATSITLNLSGQAIGKYGLVSTTAVASATILPLTLSANVTAANKTYDGTAAATISNCSPSGVLSGDVVSCSATSAAFASANAGTWTVTATGISLNGPQYANYSLSSTSATTTATINKATASLVTSAPAGSIYGQPVTLTVTLTPPSGTTPTGQVTLFYTQNQATYNMCPNGSVGTAPCSANIAPFASSFGTSVTTVQLPVGTETIIASYSGDSNFNSGIASNTSVTVVRADTVMILSKSADPSVYGDPAVLTVRVKDNTPNSTGIPTGAVTLSYKVNATDPATYYLCGDGSIRTALCPNGMMLVPDNTDPTGKTAVATVSASRLPAGTASGAFAYGINASYSGDANFNGSAPYGLPQTVAPRSITVTASADSKVYDGTTTSSASPVVTSGFLVGVDSGRFTQTFDTRNVGAAKAMTPAGSINDGNGGNNYTITFAKNFGGTITARSITVTPSPNTKTYDGTTSAAGVPVIGTPGLAPGDSANFTESYMSKNAGTGLTLIPAGSVSDGNGGNNYTVVLSNGNSGTITKAALTITATGNTKMFDGTTVASALPTSSALVGGDTISGLAETYDTPGAAVGKALTVSSYSINDGNGGNNYAVTKIPVSTGVVTPFIESGSVSVSAGELQYTAAETFTAALPVGVVGGEAAASFVSFYICPAGAITVSAGCQNMTPSPVPMMLSATALTASATVPLIESVKGALIPGAHAVLAVFTTSSDFSLNVPQAALQVDKKITVPTANTMYTGAPVLWTVNDTSKTATLFLTATVTDPCGTLYPAGYAVCGNVSLGTVTFNAWNGTSLTPIPGAVNVPVGLVNPGVTTVGTAAVVLQYNIGKDAANPLDIRVTAGTYFAGGDPNQNAVSITPRVDLSEMKLTASTLCNSAAAMAPAGATNLYGTCASDWSQPGAGFLAGEPMHLTQIDGDVTLGGNNPQGSVTLQVVSMYRPDGTLDTVAHTYLIKSNSIATFSRTATGAADFTARASITDVATSVTVDGGSLLQLTACAPGATCAGLGIAGGAGAVGVQINSSSNGAVWFSSGWTGSQTVPQNAVAGVVAVN